MRIPTFKELEEILDELREREEKEKEQRGSNDIAKYHRDRYSYAAPWFGDNDDQY